MSTTEDRERLVEEVAAAIEARRELGERMEPHVAESFLGRIEGAIEKRVDERLAQHGPRPAVRPSSLVAIASLVFGVGATAIVTDKMDDGAALVALLFIWLALAAINWAYARARGH